MNPDERHVAGSSGGAFLRLFAGALATLVLGGCLSTVPIKVEDKRVFLPAVRAAYNLDDDKQDASEPQTGRAIEFGLAKAKGGGNQYIASNQEQVILNNMLVTGPQQLRNDFDFTFANISWRSRKFFQERSMGLELFGGIGFTSLDLTVSSSTLRASGRFDTAGGQGGVGLIWRASPSTSIQGRVAVFLSAADQGVTSIGRYELFFAHALDKNLTLRAGYAGWALNGPAGSGMSDFKLRFSGPTVVLDWDFYDRPSKSIYPAPASTF